MTKIVISGYYGFGNAGDEAMLAALLDSIRDVIHDADITVITGNCKITEANHGVHTVGRMDILGIFNAIRKCHILISGGGSLLQDVTSSRSLYYYLAIIRIAQFFHKPVMLYAQGIGPVNHPNARKTVKDILQKVDMITVRDEASKAELESIGVTKPHIEVTADAVLSINPVDKKIGFRLLEKNGVTGIGTKIGICVRDWKDAITYKKEIASAADRLHENRDATIIFIPMQYPDDIKASQDIQQMMSAPSVLLNKAYSTTELMSVIGCMDAILGIRLHALVFAALMHIPETAISYDPKIDSFIDLIGEHLCGTLDTVNADMLFNDLNRKLTLIHPDATIINKVKGLHDLSLRNAFLALTVIEKHTKH